MLWVVGILAALIGSLLFFLSIWFNYEGGDKNKAIVLGTIGFTGSVYTILIFVMNGVEFPKFVDYATLLMGLAVLGVNLGRAFVAPIFGKILSREKMCFSKLTIFNTLFETFLIFVLLIGVLLYTINMGTDIDFAVAKMAMIYVSSFSIISGLALGYMFKKVLNSDESPEKMCRKKFPQIMVHTMPAQVPAILGMLLAILELVPYMSA